MTTVVDANPIKVAVETLAYIKANPSEWDQGLWDKCFAGHFARLDPEVSKVGKGAASCDCCQSEVLVCTVDGDTHSVLGWFTDRLGDEVACMTAGSVTLLQLEAAVKAMSETGGSVADAMREAHLREEGYL